MAKTKTKTKPTKTAKTAKTAKSAQPRNLSKLLADVEKIEALLRNGCTASEYATAVGISRQGAARRLQKAVADDVLTVEAEQPPKLTANDLFHPPTRGRIPQRVYRLRPAKG